MLDVHLVFRVSGVCFLVVYAYMDVWISLLDDVSLLLDAILYELFSILLDDVIYH